MKTKMVCEEIKFEVDKQNKNNHMLSDEVLVQITGGEWTKFPDNLKPHEFTPIA